MAHRPEDRIAALKRQHGCALGPRLDHIWCGWRVLRHKATKIAALSI